MNDDVEVNRAFWDEIAPHHAASDFYAVEEFVSGQDSLGAIEHAELGPVDGLTVCHLQCHIGLDSLSLARRGAGVTGLDFSEGSLRVARGLAARLGAAVTFVQADVLDAAAVLASTFDLVFTTRGVLMWVSDLERWAQNCAALVRPGGTFYLLDIHPLAMVLHPGDAGMTLSGDYFGGAEPAVTSADASYAVTDVGLTHQQTREWPHPVGEVVTAVAAAGLMIDFVHEHPGSSSSVPTIATSSESTIETRLPALYSIRAHRPPQRDDDRR